MQWWKIRKTRQALQELEQGMHDSAVRIVAAIKAGNDDGSIKTYLQNIEAKSEGGNLAQETEKALATVLDAASGYLQGTMNAAVASREFRSALRILAYMTYIMDVQNADHTLKDKWFAEYVTEFLHSRNPGETHVRIRKTTLTFPGEYTGRDVSFFLDCENARLDGKLKVGPLFPLLTEVVHFYCEMSEHNVLREYGPQRPL